MTQKFLNNTKVILDAAVDSTATQLDLVTGQGSLIPAINTGEHYLATLHLVDYSVWEVVKVTAKSGDSLTVVRGYEGSAVAWEAGTYLSFNITADTMQRHEVDIETALSDSSQALATANNAITKATEAESNVRQVELTRMVFSIDTAPADGSDTTYDYYKIVLGDSSQAGFDSGYGHYGVVDGSSKYNTPIPYLGLLTHEQNRVLVYLNGVLLKTTQLYFDGFVPDDTNHQNQVQILGHRSLRIVPPPAVGDLVEVFAPPCPWMTTSMPYKGYNDVYADGSGITKSYIGGGTGPDTNNIQEYDWYTELCTQLSSTYQLSDTYSYGAGAVTNASSSGYFFGGDKSGAVTKIHKLQFMPSLQAVTVPDNLSAATKYGTSFTDSTVALICGVGPDETYKAVDKYDLTTEYPTTTSLTVAGSSFQYPSSFSVGDYGYVFNWYDDSSNGGTYVQKYQFSTEALASQSSALNTNSYAKAVSYFNSGSAFLWSTNVSVPLSTQHIFHYDTATDTISASMYMYHSSPQVSTHDTICDGELYGLRAESALMVVGSEAVTVARCRTQSAAGSYLNRSPEPVGAFNDFWYNC